MEARRLVLAPAEGAVLDDHGVLLARLPDGKNLIPSFPWIAPGWRVGERNPREGRDQILQRSVAEP